MNSLELADGNLVARVTDNSERFISQLDSAMGGYNGLASLRDVRQGKNIFVHAGLNYECGSTDPRMGRHKDAWNAPRLAPMALERLDTNTVRLSQKADDAGGLDVVSVYSLRDPYVDLAVTFSPDGEIESSSTFWASYMNQVQNTSLFLRGAVKPGLAPSWLEYTSAGHGRTFVRPLDPTGMQWHDYLQDNPVLRQRATDTPEGIAATEAAGFAEAEIASFDLFQFGFVDDYLFLLIFREGDGVVISPWISAVGGGGVRSPAWDFGTKSEAQAAGEERTFSARLVFKPFQGIDDVLHEVSRFQEAKR
jgi:hypothetical protein